MRDGARNLLAGPPTCTAAARRVVSGVVICAALAGCTVGPDFKSPAPTAPGQEGWTGQEHAASDRPVTSVPLPGAGPVEIAEWWRVFNDPHLTSLVERAAGGNLTLAQAESRVRQARAAVDVAASGWYPQVNAAASAERARTRNGTSNFFRAGFDAAWEIDVFGGIRRGVEASRADVESAVLDRESLMVTLAGEVASLYFDVRGSQRQLAIARKNLEAQQRTYELTKQRLAAGFVSAFDAATARANVTQVESQIPAFDAQLRTSIYALSVLIGAEPQALIAELAPDAPLPAVPGEVPVGLPSELLQRRPDIQRAEADLHAATARMGVAVAQQYPRFSLTGTFGTQGSQVASLGTLADRYWSIGPAVSVPLFTGGRIQGDIEQARAVAEQATLAYRQAVLTALQDVETSLVNFTREQQRRAALVDSVDANEQAVDLALQLYNAGRTDFLNVLVTQRQLYNTEAQLTVSETNVATNLVALYKALGGGWPGAEPTAPDIRPEEPLDTSP